MNKFSLKLPCQIYLVVALLFALLSPQPYSPLALALVLVMLFLTFRPQPPRVNIAMMAGTIFLLPLILAPLLPYVASAVPLPLIALESLPAIAALPAVYLLDDALRQNAPEVAFTHLKEGRFITALPRTLFVAVMVMLLVSLAVNNRVLLFSSLILTLYLLATLGRVLKVIPRQPLDIPATGKRIMAHATDDIPLSATSRATVKLYCQLTPVEPWVKASPERFRMNQTKMELTLSLTPPLAGPAHPQVLASVIDPWGFTQLNQTIEPVELHVIPRAKYAEWLARRYLERAGTGVTAYTAVPTSNILWPRRGIEYYDSRNYQPGDQLKDIDWRHTLKLSRLITKEYTEASAQSAIIASNLTVADAEEADKLAFNLITTALTLARQGTPTALVAYNQERVIATRPLAHPNETLKQTLSLVKEITLVTAPHYYLQPPDITRLRRNISQLREAAAEPAQQLMSLLNFEYQAIEQAAQNHPATLALSQMAKQVSPPAIIILVSGLNDDAVALTVTLEKLRGRGFATLRLEEAAT